MFLHEVPLIAPGKVKNIREVFLRYLVIQFLKSDFVMKILVFIGFSLISFLGTLMPILSLG